MRQAGVQELHGIVLAAGEGSRLAALTRRLYGDERPKQFARLHGTRTLLQETLVRQASLVPPARTVVVVSERHQFLADAQLRMFRGVDLVCQPRNVGTGPGLLLPLARVMARAPGATVLVTPSDHHYRLPERFLAQVRRAVAAAEASAAGLCLLGAPAERAATDLGWIVPGPRDAAGGFAAVERFVEKPGPAVAAALHRAGGLWNTFVMVGAAERLWALARQHLPAQAALLERYRAAVDTPRERPVLREVYRSLAPADFSRDVLARAQGLAVVPLVAAGWSDWGTPERLLESLAGTPARVALERRLASRPLDEPPVEDAAEPRALI
jgi:mannose-1-phosphate guanylyltransferase